MITFLKHLRFAIWNHARFRIFSLRVLVFWFIDFHTIKLSFYHLDCFFPLNGTFITSWYFNPITFYSTVVKFIVSLSNHLTSTGMFLIANFLIAMSRLWFYNQKWLSFRLTFFYIPPWSSGNWCKSAVAFFYPIYHSTKKGPSIEYAMT